MNKTYKRQWAATQRGAGLLEVLVAVLVLGIGVLGIAALQSIALKNAGSSASTTNATIQAYAALDMLRTIDPKDIIKGSTYNFDYRSSTSGTVGTVDGWLIALKTTVAPDAQGKIQCTGSGPVTCTVGVQWDDTRSGGDEAHHVEVTSQL